MAGSGVEENFKTDAVNIEDTGVMEKEFDFAGKISEHKLNSKKITTGRRNSLVGSGKSNSKSVSGVVGLGRRGEVKKFGDHEDNLLLVGVPVTGDSEFDFIGSEFEEWEVMTSGGEEDNASCVSDGNGSGGVPAEE